MNKTMHRFTLAAMAVAVATATPQVIAQQELEEVIVTGSRIPVDANAVSSGPVQSVSEDDIRNSGEINIADIVADIPALVSSLTAENSSTGANQLNLRGLGGDRTLTLVNGRRHVAGFRGSQAVDVGTIPRSLVERVEVTTGGASAIYGADAVTGVVNFILKDDFEGFELDVSSGRPQRGAGETTILDITWGKNFDNGRGNVVLTVSSESDNGITHGERSWSRDNGIYASFANPDPDPNAPPEALVNDVRYWLTSNEGSIAPGFGGRDTTYVDINGNGIADCQESLGGRDNFLAGCWYTNPDGSVSVFQDGTFLERFLATGGDGAAAVFNADSLYPVTDRQVFNLNARYDFTDNLTGFIETKYVKAESETYGEYDGYFDTIEIKSDNPFVPAELAPVMDQVGYLVFTKDAVDWSVDDPDIYTRETTRVVAGLEWTPAEGHTVEFSINQGTFEQTNERSSILLDRFYAAMDSTTDDAGNPVCRSDLDPTAAYPVDYFAIVNGYNENGFAFPYSDRYYTFTPGDGQCRPLDPFGLYASSAEARDFISTRLKSNLEIEQLVLNVTAVGSLELSVLDVVLDGPIGYAAGLEYRDESSDNRLDPLTLGILPQGTSFTAGQLVNDVSPWLFGFTSFDNTQQFNTQGSYDVTDMFAEVRLPIFMDRSLAKELTVDAAIRQADYSTLGEATTWKFGATWAPISDLMFRATVSEAVRAPNIRELYDPQLPLVVDSGADPCDPDNINDGTAVRQENCVAELTAAGIDIADILDGDGNYIWTNPLTGRFFGLSGGNPLLDVETAETDTVGVVFTPSFVEGLTVSLDYWNVTIEDAISAVGASQIMAGCFDSASFPNVPFCEQYSRRADGGLDNLITGEINFARLEADGLDVSISYEFAIGQNNVSLRMTGSEQNSLKSYFNPSDPDDVNLGVKEVGVPEQTMSVSVGVDRGPWAFGAQSVYQSKQAVASIETVLGLEGFQALYGDDGFFDSVLITDINARYQWSDEISVFGAVNNITDEEPFSTQTAWPVGPRGRTFILGVSYSM